ncbi:MAG: CusA/CzcA family heavy metal efflux RND transporter [Bacteroidetes bacterium]|jgi:cobalt-zinc-cadmium resistance protein CzcA|nr:CusA/CzcA family heavy metal efflux RND transporter [Bacteroidota bacterium]MCL6102708.1 CusA/CzcA family heavy metal efflux RND transporter [Bacteroidota bacterium]
MIDKIIAYSIKNKFIVSLILLALIGVGIYSLKTINLDSTPDITNNQVQVITVSQNLSTEDIEQFVTYPVELAMANLPGVTEIRSVSRFGLSVVTIVFKDNMGTYLPRQVVQEKLNAVKDQIPSQFGEPFMGPITTGLGEIFQYTIKPKPGFDSIYSPMDLRTIQDWIVKRQMALIPGVVEVNSFGGNIKQYEIALNPDKLNAMNVSMTEVFEALENNNVNTGGAYIEKSHMANFIRGEGLARTLDDIKNIVIKNDNGIPILINDVAEKVHFGSQVRYGAFTQEGHEAVGGMILMLKGENSNEVIQNVKNRIDEVQKTLPKGLEIAPFLDRSALIERTTSTVSRNLMEGALIVIFVLVILLGSLRGGLVTASVIPLSLLFAFILMKVFDVWANLMSLGAIDFGIIVDGAVIIVEGTVHEIEKRIKAGKNKFDKIQMNELTYHASSTMMNSAFFGQLIILIVFAPILFLTGVEGKMFRPMAFTFGFAVIGAILLCLTYVPMISSIVMKPTINKNSWLARLENLLERISNRFLNAIYAAYKPILTLALKRKKSVLIVALLLLGSAVFVFTRMGGEFVPSLNEGDIAMQAFLRPGSSLSETIKREKEVENIIMANFPEVKTVCARIGVADIPTDPMGFDYTDSFIILEKDMNKWVSAKSKEELIEKIKSKLSQLPGLNFTFSQPVELRFNELLTGVREDVAVKLFGEDLDVLSQKGEKMLEIISKIPGAEDVTLERTAGLPQMTVQYDRKKIAQYGLDISKLNRYVSAAFAGSSAGVIFEGEKRFDMVIRLDEQHRKSIEDLRNLYVDLPNGKQVPIKELAEINFQPGAMQISREGTFRRIYVGVNVRGRDVESVVNDIQQKLDKQLNLPAGYYVTYGGEFENLQRAKDRLSIVLPIALALIFILLYFALKSFPQTVMIYMAVPLAAIGGVYFLWLRGMPFSISAGVGFIVLFGVAVLNGLVLISRFNSLKTEGVNDLMERISVGTQERLRPILLTATAAMLGFLPMAISGSAGAEVQRPLATVVIGGLFSATFLTLVVIPVLYALVESLAERRRISRTTITITPLIIFLFLSIGLSIVSTTTQAQGKDSLTQISLDKAINRAKNNFPLIKAAQLDVKNQQVLKKTVWDFGNTEFSTGAEELGKSNNGIYTTVGIRQDFDILSIGAKSRVQNKLLAISQTNLNLTKLEVSREVSVAWGNTYSAKKTYQLYLQLDSIFKDFERAARLRYETQATSKLEYLSASNQAKQISIQKEKSKRDYLISLQRLNLWFVSDTIFTVDDTSVKGLGVLQYLRLDSAYQHPELQLYEQRVQLADARLKLMKSGYLPKFTAEYGSQKIGSQSGYYKYQVGISIPLFFNSQLGKTQSAKLESSIARENYSQKTIEVMAGYKILYDEYKKWLTTWEYYRDVALPVAKEQKNGAIASYREGAIDYISFLQNVKDAMEIEFNYWNAYGNYLDSRFKVEYFINSSK